MARTLSDIRTLVLKGFAREDSVAITLCDQAINMAIEVIALAFNLPEFRKLGTVTFGAGVDELDVTDTANMQDVISMYNTTDDLPMGFVSIEKLDFISPSSGKPRVWCKDGTALLVKPTPAKDTQCSVRYTVYPSRISEANTAIPFEGHEGQLISVSTMILWAFVEEVDTSQLWSKIVELLNISYTTSAKARQVIEGIADLKEMMGGVQ